jgi:hypothetical protein
MQDTGAQNLVRQRERIGKRGLLVRHPEQVLVRNDEQGIDDFLQLEDAGLRHLHPAHTLEVERLGHHAHRQDTEFLRATRHHRRRAGAGAATHAGGDEHHVRALQMVADFVDHLFGGGAAHFRLGAGTEPLGDLHAHLNDAFRFGHRQGLGVGIGDHELAALQPAGDHVVDGVAAGAAGPEHGNPWLQLTDIGNI